MANFIYLAVSLDGFIATPDGGVDWLSEIPNPEKSDFGFGEFIKGVDALLMGSATYEKVLSFGQWPYECPVFVLSSREREVPEELLGKVEFVKGPLVEVMEDLRSRGMAKLYVDGGKVIQKCLREDLIDEMIITRVPVLLGGGIPLFGDLENMKWFRHLGTEVLVDSLVKSHYVRIRDGCMADEEVLPVKKE